MNKPPDQQWDDLEAATRFTVELEAIYYQRKLDSSLSLSAMVPKRIGRFEISQRLGAGGFGLVFKGRDTTLGRTVAVKVPRDWVLDSPRMMRRFARESQAAAKLDHPNIVPIYEAGQDGPLPFIAYAFCDGPSLANWLKDHDGLLTPTLAVEILIPIIRAIDCCHQAGILHRDIKPANILLFPSPVGIAAGFRFTPKVADLGLAKLIHTEVDETASAAFLGTPLFMAPEQAIGGEVGPPSDVYSLGATLYLLLVGRSPFVANTVPDLLKQLADCEPVPPLSLNPAVPLDLNTICLKCLEKTPSRRYAGAGALANDLQRWMANEPIAARPTSTTYRLVRWCRRNTMQASLIGGVTLLLVGLIGSLIWNASTRTRFDKELASQNRHLAHTVVELNQALTTTEQQRALASSNRKQALQLLYASDLQNAADLLRRNDPRSAVTRLDRDELSGFEREFSWRFLRGLLKADNRFVSNVRQSVWCSRVSPDNRYIAVAGNRGTVQVFEGAGDHALVRQWDTKQIEVNNIAFSRDGRLLATAGDDGRLGLWKVETGSHIAWFDVLRDRAVFGVEFIRDDTMLIACGRATELFIFDISAGKKLETIQTPHLKTIEAITVSHDGRRLATAGAEGIVAVFNTEDWTIGAQVGNHYGDVLAICFTQDDSMLVSGGKDATVRVYDGTHLQQVTQFDFRDAITGLTLSGHDQLAIADRSGVIRLIDLNSHVAGPHPDGKDPKNWLEPLTRCWVSGDATICGLEFIDNDQSLLSADSRGSVDIWPVGQEPATQTFTVDMVAPNETRARLSAGANPSGFVAATDKGLVCWDTRRITDRHTKLSGRSIRCCHYQRDTGKMIVAEHGKVGILKEDSPGSVRWRTVTADTSLRNVEIDLGDSWMVALTETEVLTVTDLRSGQESLRLENQSCFALSPDGAWLISASHGSNHCEVFELKTLNRVATIAMQKSTIHQITVSSNGKWCACASGDRTIAVVETASWKEVYSLRGHTHAVKCVAFSPDSLTIASGDEHGIVKLWHVASGQELLELAKKQGAVNELKFSRDGEHLAAWIGDATIELHSVRPSKSPPVSTN